MATKVLHEEVEQRKADAKRIAQEVRALSASALSALALPCASLRSVLLSPLAVQGSTCAGTTKTCVPALSSTLSPPHEESAGFHMG